MCQCSGSVGMALMALSSMDTTFPGQRHIAREFGQHLGIIGTKIKKQAALMNIRLTL